MEALPGQFPNPQQLPTPPESPHKRRKELRDSSETEGYMSIEEYLYRCDPYRSTTERAPFPYPLTLHPAPAGIVSRVESCRSDILRILSDEGFPEENYLHLNVQDVCKPEYPLGDRVRTTLRLVYFGAPYAPRELGPTRDIIEDLLRTKNIYDLLVEIVFLDKCFRPSIFSIPPSDPAVAPYNSAKQRILELVHSAFRSEWRTLSLHKVGLTKNKSTASIVIFVDPFTTADWANLATRIRLLLPPNNPASMGITVEFLPGKIFTLPTSVPASRPKHGLSHDEVMDEDGIPKPGTSITVLPGTNAGSLGPFITLRGGGKTLNLALTNFHVVKPPPSTDPAIKERADRYRTTLHGNNQTGFNVSYFASMDAEATAFALQKTLDTSKAQLTKAQDELEMRQAADARIPTRLSDDLRDIPQEIATLEKKLNIIKPMPTHLGKVILSSGRIIIDNRVSDWALIAVDSKPFKGNLKNFTNKMPFVPIGRKLEGGRVLREGSVLDRFGDLEKGEWYCKTGRTTYFTAGTCNGVSTSCHWGPEARLRYSEDGQQESRITDGVTEEWVITAEYGPERKNVVQTPFSSDGDSGSSIIDAEGKICGLIYGGARGLCGHHEDQLSAICSTMSDVRAWIEDKASRRDGEGNIVERYVVGLPTGS